MWLRRQYLASLLLVTTACDSRDAGDENYEPVTVEEPTPPPSNPPSPEPDAPQSKPTGCSFQTADAVSFFWMTGGCFAGGQAILLVKADRCSGFGVNGTHTPTDPLKGIVAITISEAEYASLVNEVNSIDWQSVTPFGIYACNCMDCPNGSFGYSAQGMKLNDVLFGSPKPEHGGTFCFGGDASTVALSGVAFSLFGKYAAEIDDCGFRKR